MYSSEDGFWSPGSVAHMNKHRIVMQLLKKPSLLHRVTNKQPPHNSLPLRPWKIEKEHIADSKA